MIEDTTNDYYWGNGKNMLGIILMETRMRLPMDEGE
ncbi:hypothetical protein [Polycladospora coralii]